MDECSGLLSRRLEVRVLPGPLDKHRSSVVQSYRMDSLYEFRRQLRQQLKDTFQRYAFNQRNYADHTEVLVGHEYGDWACGRVSVCNTIVNAATDIPSLIADMLGQLPNLRVTEPRAFGEEIETHEYMPPGAMERLQRASTVEDYAVRRNYAGRVYDIKGPITRLDHIAGVGISARKATSVGWQPYLHDHEY